MTMHIDDAILADVMALTGAPSKTQAVEIALRDLARRYRQRTALSEGLGLRTSAQWDAAAAPSPADALDAPDIDWDAVQRALLTHRADTAEPGEHHGFAAEK